MQQVLHYSALQSGMAWLATSITSVGAGRPLAIPGHSHRPEGRDGDRDDADRRGRALGDAGPGPRPLHRQPARAVRRRRRRNRVRVHPDLDRRPGGRRGTPGGARVWIVEHDPEPRRSDRDRDRLERRRQPHQGAAARRPRGARGAHRRLPARALGARRDRPDRRARRSSRSCAGNEPSDAVRKTSVREPEPALASAN